MTTDIPRADTQLISTSCGKVCIVVTVEEWSRNGREVPPLAPQREERWRPEELLSGAATHDSAVAGAISRSAVFSLMTLCVLEGLGMRPRNTRQRSAIERIG